MCCFTHGERDRMFPEPAAMWRAVEDPRFRCQCGFGQPCWRRATGEDFRCDWCRGNNHDEWCAEFMRADPGGVVSRRGADYVSAQFRIDDGPWMPLDGSAQIDDGPWMPS